jgi:hypothetical protein
MASVAPTRRFTSDLLAGLDEPVRRYFSHAVSDGAALSNGVRIAMSGRIKVGLSLPFTAEQTVDGRSFEWRARVGWGPLTPLRVTDRYADAAGSTEGRLLGRVALFHAEDLKTARSAATAGGDRERCVFAAQLGARPRRDLASRNRQRHPRALRAAARAPRGSPADRRARRDPNRQRRALGDAGEKTFQYIPFGGDVHAERRFGDLVLPSTLSVGWWFGTPRYAPFFRAEINAVTPMP